MVACHVWEVAWERRGELPWMTRVTSIGVSRRYGYLSISVGLRRSRSSLGVLPNEVVRSGYGCRSRLKSVRPSDSEHVFLLSSPSLLMCVPLPVFLVIDDGAIEIGFRSDMPDVSPDPLPEDAMPVLS